MASRKKDPYAQLWEISKTTAVFESIHGLLGWDQETYMPEGAAGIRSQELEQISSLIHKQRTSPKFVKALGKLIDLKTGEIFDAELSEVQRAALHEWRRDYLKAAKLPVSFVKTLAKESSSSLHAWIKAREKNAFDEFAPHLQKMVTLSRKKADLLGFAEHPYDPLLDWHEPDMTTAAITPLFNRLKIALTSLLKEISFAPQIPSAFLEAHFPPSKQLHFGHLLLKAMHVDEKISRLDESAHPFCSGLHPTDTRLTTRIHPDNLMSNIFSVMHEGGHALYNIGLPTEQFGTPLCQSSSLGMDESQSRFWETRIARTLSFWKHFFPMLQHTFPEQLSGVYLDDFYRAINVVKPSLIRVEADEVTYSLHVIIRFEIEKALIEGTLAVKDLPEAWNEKMRTYLGITPSSDKDGCLQDIHWAYGLFGYFPTYTLGNIYAAQFFNVFEKEHPDWKERTARGELEFVRAWLRMHIHQYGRRFTPQELVQRVTGERLNEQPYVSYLENKYKALYHIS
jgi:carboxypeptidase Taq